MRRLVAIAAFAVLLTGCGEPVIYPKYEVNQTKRHEYFLACMAALPAGPQKTQYNDWDEVVGECASAAYYQALYCYENCPPAQAYLLAKHGGPQ